MKDAVVGLCVAWAIYATLHVIVVTVADAIRRHW